MKAGPFRIETDWFEGDEARTSRSFGFNVPETEVPDSIMIIVDQALDDLRALGCTDPIGFMLTETMVRTADAHAYQREAQRRGVLAL